MSVNKKRSRSEATEHGAIAQKLDVILARLDAIDARISHQEQLSQHVRTEEKKIEAEEQKIEKGILRIGAFTVTRNHVMEGIRGTAGAFLGVGLGRGLLNMDALANSLSWAKIIGLLVFILGISWLLIYKNMRMHVKNGWAGIWYRLIGLFTVSIVVEWLALWLYDGIPSSPDVLVKILIIGSYAAMAGAVSLLVL